MSRITRMSRRSALALATAAALVATAVQAEPVPRQVANQVWLDARSHAADAANAPAPVAKGVSLITTFATLEDFEAATATMPLVFEDFSARDPLNVSPCYEPVNHYLGQPGTNFYEPVCFMPETLKKGFSLRSDIGAGQVGFGIYAFGQNTIGPGFASNIVGGIAPGAVAMIDFLDEPVAVSMDVYDWQAVTPLTLTVIGMDDAVIGEFTVAQPDGFTPAFAGFVSSAPVKRVEVRSLSGATQMIGNLRFGGSVGRFEAADAEIDFGAVGLGDSGSAIARFDNVGSLPAMASLSGVAAPFSVVDDGCTGVEVAAGGSCEVELGYSPTLAMTHDAPLALAAGDDAATTQLTGRGAAPRLSMPDTLGFGLTAPGGSSTRVAVLSNVSAVTLTVSGIDVPSAPFARVGGDCPATAFELAPGEACTIALSFSPAGAGDSVQGLLVASDDPGSPKQLRLFGTTEGSVFRDGFEPGAE